MTEDEQFSSGSMERLPPRDGVSIFCGKFGNGLKPLLLEGLGEKEHSDIISCALLEEAMFSVVLDEQARVSVFSLIDMAGQCLVQF